jgi:hypothetical protein
MIRVAVTQAASSMATGKRLAALSSSWTEVSIDNLVSRVNELNRA